MCKSNDLDERIIELFHRLDESARIHFIRLAQDSLKEKSTPFSAPAMHDEEAP
jgi:hypothetical protein